MKTVSLASVVFLALAANPQILAGRGEQASPAGTAAPAVRHSMKVLHGKIGTVDRSAKTLAIEMADGGRTLLHFTDSITVLGHVPAGKAADLAGMKGTHVVLHYSDVAATSLGGVGARTAEGVGKGLQSAGERTAHAIVLVGGPLNLAEGTLDSVDHAGRSVAIVTDQRVRELFRLSDDCTINTAHSIERVATASAGLVRKGVHVVVYYTQEGGEKVVHVIEEGARAL